MAHPDDSQGRTQRGICIRSHAWRFFLLIILFAPIPAAAGDRPWACLPPVFDRGQRLHPLPTPAVFWLELLLRQHELCWRRPVTPDELRVAVFGSSAVYGYPLPSEEVFTSLINERFAAADIPAHLFNLAFVSPYQVRDALLIAQALAYQPDVIVYPVTLAEFSHRAPIFWATLIRFFNMNYAAMHKLTEVPPAGLEQPFALYAKNLARTASSRHSTDQLQDTGLYLREAMRTTAESIATTVNSPQRRVASGDTRRTTYDCAETRKVMARDYRNWKDWSILPYLADLERSRGIRVLVVHWPVAHDPIDDCYSARFTNVAVADFSEWLRAETTRWELAYLDLAALLSTDSFIDTIHMTSVGHQQVADRVARVLTPMLQNLAAQRAQERRP